MIEKTKQLETNFTKKVTVLPDGRQLIYYNFTSGQDAAAPDNLLQPERKGE